MTLPLFEIFLYWHYEGLGHIDNEEELTAIRFLSGDFIDLDELIVLPDLPILPW